ncbi:IclR family transcriptional regulator [Allopusillimonas soli]|uniref:IclR family transcriptional regulator n=1 Tax=Allopusillimonas soli TaxID=659016 RepID=A0A853F7G0_9BURK|nr:IclR family transcriptional regulator [Allopusillimonas soli]NYT35917.1 IclR family transcriptional regulator [Allopusillimonas soli]TEA76274.1 IclR family transcriptional regulator [Allopusillimonas soli]
MPATIPAVTRVMSIFETFARERRDLGNSEIARLIGVPDSSCADLLHTLHQAGYVVRMARSKRFYPTSRLQAIASGIAENDPLAQVSTEAIETLTEKTGETALCGRLESGFVRIVGFNEGRYELRYILKVGEKIALHASALGKALLSVIPQEEAQQQLRIKPLRKLTPDTVTSLPLLERNIEETRSRGWSETQGEGVIGVAALAVAGIINGEPIAVSLAGPTDRLSQNRDRYLAALLDVRNLIFSSEDVEVGKLNITSRLPKPSSCGPSGVD